MIELESNKAEKEIQKLDLEIKQLQISWWKKPNYLTILVTFVSIFVGILTGFIDVKEMELGYKNDIDKLTTKFIEDTTKLNKELVDFKSRIIKTDEIEFNTIDSVLNFRLAGEFYEGEREEYRVKISNFDLSDSRIHFEFPEELWGSGIIITAYFFPYSIKNLEQLDTIPFSHLNEWDSYVKQIEEEFSHQDSAFYFVDFYKNGLSSTIKSTYMVNKEVYIGLLLSSRDETSLFAHYESKWFYLMKINKK